MIRRDLMRGSEMDLRYLTQCARPLCFHELFCGLLYVCRCSPLESEPKLFSSTFQPVDESFTRQNRRSRNRDV
jgi:hypothetical protein